MDKVRFGIIGIGNQGNYYAKLLTDGKIENGVLSAICDNKSSKLDAAKEKYNGVEFFDDFVKMVESGVCDAVLVTTPHYFHPEIVMECLKHNINTLCDKPAGVYTEQVLEMNEFAKGQKALFGMMFNQRTNCLYRKMKEIIANGELGQLQRVNWIITDWYRTDLYYKSGGWRATWAGEGGGVLINQAPHQIDLIQWIVGQMPKSVRGFCGYGRWHDIEVEDEVTAFFEYENGATGVFITTTGEAPGTNRLEISGTKGKLLCEDGKLIWHKNETDSQENARVATHGFARPEVKVIEVETDGKNEQHAGIINNFANAILKKEELFVQGTDGVNGVELMNAIELSGWRGGEKVELPINGKEYLEELNVRRANSVLKDSEDIMMDISNSFGSGAEKK
ncbi:MAG: Gfo/Idh/MocA family oxidoreductase [Clostridia bacterium]|nr:Gfo/Idh/MocA family oxidoreductase [Clostridia bacterium]